MNQPENYRWWVTEKLYYDCIRQKILIWKRMWSRECAVRSEWWEIVLGNQSGMKLPNMKAFKKKGFSSQNETEEFNSCEVFRSTRMFLKPYLLYQKWKIKEIVKYSFIKMSAHNADRLKISKSKQNLFISFTVSLIYLVLSENLLSSAGRILWWCCQDNLYIQKS